MAEVRPFRESIALQEETRSHDSARLETVQAATVSVNFCAYNQTVQRFISNQVEVVDSTANSFEDGLSKLTPNSGTAIWIIPVRDLPATSFRFPVDLLYLSENCTVLGVAHSFPIGRIPLSIVAASSVLALPTHNVLPSEIGTGDQLLVCSPEEMERKLLQGYTPTLEIAEKPQLIRNGPPRIAADQNVPVAARESFGDEPRDSNLLELSTWEERLRTPTCALSADPAPAPSTRVEPKSDTAQSPMRFRKNEVQKKWWQKLLLDEHDEDNRQAPRLALPELVAYFFTGAAPVAHKVRNISASGLYVLTSERWYKGTVVRITLTDEREPTKERSITVHGIVVRYMDDGVALQFVAEGENQRHRGTASTLEHLPAGANAKQIEEFIVRFRSGS